MGAGNINPYINKEGIVKPGAAAKKAAVQEDNLFPYTENDGVNKTTGCSDEEILEALNDVDLEDESSNKSLKSKNKNISSENTQKKQTSVEKALMSEIEAELKKIEEEIKTDVYSKSGLGALWNGVKGVFGGGTAGQLQKNSELYDIYRSLSSNASLEEISALYEKVFGCAPDIEAAKKSTEVAKGLKNGEFKIDDNTVLTQEDVANIVISQVETLAESFDNSVKSQGIVSKIVGGVNNFIGIGTTENMTKAQLETYQNLANELAETTDPEKFAALYKAITGESLSLESLDELLGGVSKVENSKSAESMMDYERTTDAIKNTAIAVGVGIAVATTGPIGALAIGTAATVGVNALDAATQTNGEGVVGNLVDYAKKDLLKDALVGGINGLTGKLGNMAGEKLVSVLATKSLGSATATSVTQTAIEQAAQKGLSATAQQAAANTALKSSLSNVARIATEFVDGAVDAGLSSAAEYVVSAAAGENGNFTNENGEVAIIQNLQENFDAGEMLGQVTMSTLMGGAMSVGMQEGMSLIGSAVKRHTGADAQVVSDAPDSPVSTDARGASVETPRGVDLSDSRFKTDVDTPEAYSARLQSRYGDSDTFMFQRAFDDEYARLRGTDSYVRNYGDLNLTGDTTRLAGMLETNIDTFESLEANGALVYQRSGWSWRQGSSVGDAVDRVSLNVSGNPDLISELDTLMISGKYVNAAGEEITLTNRTPFQYKTPETTAKWGLREDPITMYFGGQINDETAAAITEITSKYARGSLHNGLENAPWMSIDTYPTREMLDSIVEQAKKVDPKLATALESQLIGSDYNISSGQYQAYQNVIAEYADFKGVDIEGVSSSSKVANSMVEDTSSRTIDASDAGVKPKVDVSHKQEGIVFDREYISETSIMRGNDEIITIKPDNVTITGKPIGANEILELSPSGEFVKVNGDSTVRFGSQELEVNKLLEGKANGTYTIGRGSDCDIRFDDLDIADRQFAILKNGDDYYVMSVDNAQGTKVIGGTSTKLSDKLAELRTTNPGFFDDVDTRTITERLAEQVESIKTSTPEQIDARLQELGVNSEIIESLREQCNSGAFSAEDYAKFIELRKFNLGDYQTACWAANASVESIQKLERILESGISMKVVDSLRANCGAYFEYLGDAQIDALLKLSDIQLLGLTNVADGGWISDIFDMKSVYGTYNFILHGERLDTGLSARVTEIGKKYGVKINIDNDAVSRAYQGSTPSAKFVSDAYIQNVDLTLQYMKNNGMKIPDTIYLTDFLASDSSGARYAGGFSPRNPGEIVMDIGIPDNQLLFARTAIMHESSHMNDWVQTADGGYWRSVENAAKMNITGTQSLADINVTISPGYSFTGSDISSYIRDYATTNVKEFVAEIGALVQNGSIRKNSSGIWIIDRSMLSPAYCTGWQNTLTDCQKLNAIMNFYMELTK